MPYPRLQRLWNVARLDKQYRRLGWWPGAYFWNFYRGRLRDHLPGKPATLKTFRCRHGITGHVKDLLLRIEPSGSDFVTLEGVWVNQDYYHPSLEGVKRILDIGGNIGLSAVWLHDWLRPDGYACVEPDPRNLAVLEKNLALNKVDAKLFRCAATAEPGEFRLGMTYSFACSYLDGVQIQDGLHGGDEFVQVPGRTVGSLLDELGWDRVDLIKCDIEGGERELLRNCQPWVDRVGQMVLEIHANTSPEEIGSFLPAGWKLERIGNTAEPTFRAFRD
jgi:FkbM family methyltransferase